MQNRIDLQEKIKIGNIDQWLAIRTNNEQAPIILFLHGGPGTAQIAFSRKPQKPLEDYFVVANWDQRGSGKSYNKNISKESMTLEQFEKDTIEVVEYLCARFKKNKIFLAGHSWGSYLGIRTIQVIPDKIHAYIGIGQLICIKKSEKISYEYSVSEAEKRHNTKAGRQLKEIDYPPYSDVKKSAIQSKWLYKFNGATKKKSIWHYIIKNISIKDITLIDVLNFFKGTTFSQNTMGEKLYNINLLNGNNKFNVPLYFCEGKHDYIFPTQVVNDYISFIEAPQKELILFENSGHLPHFEEHSKFAEICIKIKDNHLPTS